MTSPSLAPHTMRLAGPVAAVRRKMGCTLPAEEAESSPEPRSCALPAAARFSASAVTSPLLTPPAPCARKPVLPPMSSCCVWMSPC